MTRVVLGVVLLLPGIALAGQPAFVDEFEGASLDPHWQWYTPSPGPTGVLADETFVLSMPAANYDSWEGTDRGPRLRTNAFETDQDFMIETHIKLELPTAAAPIHM